MTTSDHHLSIAICQALLRCFTYTPSSAPSGWPPLRYKMHGNDGLWTNLSGTGDGGKVWRVSPGAQIQRTDGTWQWRWEETPQFRL